MEKNSLDKEKADKEFAEFGEYTSIEKKQKIKEPIEIIDVEERNIYFDERQYSCKLPPDMMKAIRYKSGDRLKFTLIKKPIEGKAELKIEYVRS